MRFIDRDIVFDIEVGVDFGNGRREEKRVQLRSEFKDLGIAFYRNHVEACFESPWEDRNKATFAPIREQIRDFCEEKLEGHWSWKIVARNITSDSRKADVHKVFMDLFFENSQDMDLFLKDCGLLIKLAN